MIESLHIKNIALIQELSLQLGGGLNILSGETGAGKSIIIDSMNFVLGDRADRSLIRHGENVARVEVVFSNVGKNALEALAEYGIPADDDIVIVTRMMTADRSECRVNGQLVNLSTLRAAASHLIDIHSQNEYQSLLKVANHIRLLDAYAGLDISNYKKTLAEFNRLNAEIDEYNSIDREREADILRYQINEINEKAPSEGEEEKLLADRSKFYNLQKILTSLSDCLAALGGNMGASDNLRRAIFALSSASKYDESLETLIARLESVKIETDDILSTVSDYLEVDRSSFDIEKLEKRLEEIRLIKKKYGKTPEEIKIFKQKAEERLEVLENAEFNLAKLNRKLSEVTRIILSDVKEFHSTRVKYAKTFSEEILKHLNDLGMKNTVFEIMVDMPATDEEILSGLNSSGCDQVEFLLSPNLGEPVKPLIKIASGGETSRFMLALKNVIAEIDDIGTLVFDEIDTGISGKIAKEVAVKLHNISRGRQVLAITHLPQLASMADRQYLISKSVSDGKTLTNVTLLEEEEMLKEIMRLAGSNEDSEVGLTHAKELKAWADSHKSKPKT